MKKDFFPQRPESHPMIYAYVDSNPQYKGLLKVGYTAIDIEKRVAQQYPTKRPDGVVPYKIVLKESAMCNDGSCFTDHEVHRVLRKKKVNGVGGEWFRCTVDDVKSAIIAVRTGTANIENRTQDFKPRTEQYEAISKTIEYFASAQKEYPNRAPKFLWNAKMRFGKTFTSYHLAKRMNFKKVLILTFKPAVETAWSEDLLTHKDFEGWQFICRGGMTYEQADKSKPIVCFGSFQDYLGTNENGGIKVKNEWVHTTNWDIVIFDEYHFGAWRENAKKIFDSEDEDEFGSLDLEKYKKEEADNAINETWLPITTSYYLFLSGTPFRAINSGEFIEDQIYNWTYSDEQREKENWGDTVDNPYAALPRMVMMTYKIPDSIRQIASQGEFNEFDLNIFFSTKEKGNDAKFIFENEVQKWLDLIHGAHLPSTIDDMKLGQDKRPPMPYSDTRLLNVLSHTFWFLPNVAACFAMRNLLIQNQNVFYHDYKINVCAGTGAGIGVNALEPVQKSMGDPLATKTITLSCGKLTTGVTVKPWTGIFMLRNLTSPETYFQAAFRVQSPWVTEEEDGTKVIQKRECYVFDFALDRALKQISDYSRNLDIKEGNPEKKVAEFVSFLPVLAYDGSSMRQISASEILDIAMSGTSATLLAKRWESALLVNVDNDTLLRLMKSKEAMAALENIEGFRSLNADIQTIINKSESVKKTKKDGNEELTPKEKKELTDDEKDYKSKRKLIQEKLIKFATRVPIFMYLTDYREYSLHDVITQLEPGLFKKVTGLNVKDFELLVSLGVFNKSVMDDAVYKFKRYEDASLSYAGINLHEGENVGLYSTVISREDYNAMFAQQQEEMVAQPAQDNDMPDKPFVVEYDDDEYESSIAEAEKPMKNIKNSKISIYKANVVPLKQNVITSTNEANSPLFPADVKKEEKPKIDTSGIKIGSALIHKTFGKGEVIAIANERITVSFGLTEKRFPFPQSVQNGFLKVDS